MAAYESKIEMVNQSFEKRHNINFANVRNINLFINRWPTLLHNMTWSRALDALNC